MLTLNCKVYFVLCLGKNEWHFLTYLTYLPLVQKIINMQSEIDATVIDLKKLFLLHFHPKLGTLPL